MADCATRRRRGGARLALAGLLFAAGALGCNHGAGPAPPADTQPEVAADEGAVKPAAPPPATDPRLTRSFDDATRQDPPPSAPRPPDTTVTGKSVGKLYTDVVRLWKDVPFVTPAGKRVEYSATLDTELGPIELGLLSDVAPNHVRNFVALARAGYYDGLSFDRIIHQVSDVEKGVTLDMVQGGGPLGADDPEEHDSLGYWLKPEISEKVAHEEGSVGAVRGEEMDSAACKFYIVLGSAPSSINGNYTIFGKVTKGIDVARKIHQRPVVEDEQEVGYRRPLKPVVITKVTIHARETDNPGTNGEAKP